MTRIKQFLISVVLHGIGFLLCVLLIEQSYLSSVAVFYAGQIVGIGGLLWAQGGPTMTEQRTTARLVDALAEGEPFVPVRGQSFASKADWVRKASRVLTAHPEYLNTEYGGPAKGWRGAHFTALCFDQQGRRVRNGGDFQRAEDDGAYPIWWVWPDQIHDLIRPTDAGPEGGE